METEDIIVNNPQDVVESPTDAVEKSESLPTDAVENPQDVVENPQDVVENPQDVVENPQDVVENPQDVVEKSESLPTDAVEKSESLPTGKGEVPLMEIKLSEIIPEYFTDILVIYSCKRYLERARKTYQFLKGKLINKKIFVLYGDPNLENDYKIEDFELIIKCNDTYDDLTNKTLGLIKFMHEVYPTKNLIKCDDDNVFNVDKFNELEIKGDYCGKTIKLNKDIVLCPNNDFIEHFRPAVTYCSGMFYYLSSLAISKLYYNDNLKYFWEDITIAKNLFELGISPINIEFYTTNYNIFNSNMISIFNDSKRKYGPDSFSPPVIQPPKEKLKDKLVIKNVRKPLNAPQQNKKEILNFAPKIKEKIPAKVAAGGIPKQPSKSNTEEILTINANAPKVKEHIPAKIAAGVKVKPPPKSNDGESIKHFRAPRLAPILLRQTAIKEKAPQISNLPQKIPN
jgi:hypothetical protein